MGRLFWKFFAFLLLAQGLASLGVGWAMHLHHLRERAAQAQVDTGPPALDQVGAASATLRHGGVPALKAFLEDIRRRDHGPQMLAVDEQGHDMLDRPLLPGPLAEARAAQAAGDHKESIQQITADGHTYLLYLPLPHGQAMGPRPPGFLPGPPPPGNKSGLPWIALAVGTGVSLILAAVLAWYFSHPIRQLRQAFQAAAQGELSLRLGPRMGARRDELADLGHSFDHMAERLQALLDSQRKLRHDVSHELRSPLARLQAAIDLLRQQPARQADLLDRIERESGRMDALVGELLTLSRLESGLTHPPEPIDLGSLLDDLIADARFEAAPKGCTLQAPSAVDLPLSGDAALLHRALENVLRNAIRHAPPGSAIAFSLHPDETRQQLEIRIADQGPGVPPAESEAIFQPFYRGSNSQPGDGHGLGLAITRSIVTAHGGSVRAHSPEGGGLTVTVTLPLVPVALF